jgi:O-antigen ligase
MQRENYLDRTQRAGIFLVHFYALSAWFNPILNHLAFIGLVCLGVIDRPTREWLIQQRIVRYALLFSLTILALSLRGMLEYNEQLPNQVLSTSKWILLSGFVFLLPWMNHQRVKPENLFGLALIGLLLGMLLHTAPGKILRFDIGSDHTNWQPRFQFSTAGMAGLSGGLCLAGLVMYRDRFFDRATGQGWSKAVLWLFAFYLTGYMLIASQSRINWLALFIILPAGLVLQRLHTRPENIRKSSGKTNLLVIGVIFALALGVWKNSAIFQERMTRDIEVLSEQKSKDFEGSSFGLRIKMMELGLLAAQKKPWFGWGNRGTSSITEEIGNKKYRSPEPDGTLIWFPHLHSSYLEILVRYGFIGLLIFGTAIASSLFRIAKSIVGAQNREIRESLTFSGLGLVMFAISNLASFRIMQEEWRAPFSMLMAIAFTNLRGRSRAIPEKSESA